MIEGVFVALGSNLGNRQAYLERARSAISLVPHVLMRASSSIEETPPLGGRSDAPYLNQMVALATRLSPNQLLLALQRIESALGRVRHAPWGSRTIDLDIVEFGAIRTSTAFIQLPHPGLPTRSFWQREIAQLRLLSSARA